MDIKSKEERSRNMSRIRAADTKPELYVRSELHRRGYRFRVNSKIAYGNPDLYFTKKRIAVFIHGCYWHRHIGCKFAYTPKSNVDFWTRKFSNNVERDKTVINKLLNNGIRVLIIWECTIKHMMADASINELYLQKAGSFIGNPNIQFAEL